MEISKISIAEQIDILEEVKQNIILKKGSYTCLEIIEIILDKYDINLFSDEIYIQEFIPLHNRYHAIKLCELNNIPVPNTNEENSYRSGWWEFYKEGTKHIPTNRDFDLARSVRIKYLDALINELKSIKICGQ